jgi:hypothetical protein
MIQITPILVGYPLQEATHLNIIPIISSTSATTCNTKWQLFKETLTPKKRQAKDENNQLILVDYIEKRYDLLLENNQLINEQEYATWGFNNTTLEDIVLGKLNLTRA